MTLEESLTTLCNEATRAALSQHLPELLSRLTLPPDSNTRHNLTEAAGRLRLPVKTVQERIKKGELKAIRDGKYTFVLESELVRYNNALRDREQFRRDQQTKAQAGVSDEITALLEPKAKR